MNVNQALKRLKVMLSNETVEVEMEEAKLVDQTEVYTEGKLEVGAILFVRAGEGTSENPFAPAGKHALTDGKIVTVGENGEITKIEEAGDEELADEEEIVEEAMEEVEVEVPVSEVAAEPAKELLEGVAELIAPFVEEVATLTEEVVELKKKYAAMAAEPAAPRVKNTFAKAAEARMEQTEARMKYLAKLRKQK